MTEEQLHALKSYIAAQILRSLCPTFENEMQLAVEEHRLDSVMLAQSSPQDKEGTRHD